DIGSGSTDYRPVSIGRFRRRSTAFDSTPSGKEFKLRTKRTRWRITVRLLAVVVSIVLVYIFVGEVAVVPTASMEGTILVGDHILLDKFLYGPSVPFTSWHWATRRAVRRGSIIAFQFPLNPKLNFLKRVAAVGGDTVEIRDDVLFVNHAAVAEPYAVHRRRGKQRAQNMMARAIPAGEVFVLGDNRDASDDSRYWGNVPLANVIG